MITLLEDILCVLEKMAAAIVGLLVLMINGMIAGIGLVISGIVAVLPDIPEAPDIPANGVLGFINYFVPLGPDLAIVTSLFIMFGLFVGFWFILKYFRAL